MNNAQPFDHVCPLTTFKIIIGALCEGIKRAVNLNTVDASVRVQIVSFLFCDFEKITKSQ